MKKSIFIFVFILFSGFFIDSIAQEKEINRVNRYFTNENNDNDIISTYCLQDLNNNSVLNQCQQIDNQNAFINQIGTALKVSLQQKNGENEASLGLFGQEINQTVVQSGSGNTINSLMVNLTSTPTEARLYQEGMNNSIVLWVNQIWNCERTESHPITISQEGNNFKLSAFIDPFVPIIVRQTNGFAGGMEVEIRTNKGQGVH